MIEHAFTAEIKKVLSTKFQKNASKILENSELLQYINLKTRAANRGSKSRGSFANHYAVYVLIEDYIKKGYHKKTGYSEYEGAKFSDLFLRQRQLPFGSKLQNHALNHRMNEEFKKFFPQTKFVPIIRDENNRYWINENLLKVKVGKTTFNIAESVIAVIDKYVETKKSAFEKFILLCEEMSSLEEHKNGEIEEFILSLIEPQVDARLFEITSYSILKYYYHDQEVYFGFELDSLTKEKLQLFKTGRTNANDGGIDFVMKPLGRFFQVTETLDIKKYFLDIDKIEHYPITFVVKSELTEDELKAAFKQKAEEQYPVKAVVKRYMGCIEEIINIPTLKTRLKEAISLGYLKSILTEISLQSKVEFNYEEDMESEDVAEEDTEDE